jgi:hypothetical protein
MKRRLLVGAEVLGRRGRRDAGALDREVVWVLVGVIARDGDRGDPLAAGTLVEAHRERDARTGRCALVDLVACEIHFGIRIPGQGGLPRLRLARADAEY